MQRGWDRCWLSGKMLELHSGVLGHPADTPQKRCWYRLVVFYVILMKDVTKRAGWEVEHPGHEQVPMWQTGTCKLKTLVTRLPRGIHSFIYLFLKYMTERDRETVLSSVIYSPNNQNSKSREKIWEPGTQFRSPIWVAGTQSSGHHHYLKGSTLAGSQNQEQSLEPSYSNIGPEYLFKILITF